MRLNGRNGWNPRRNLERLNLIDPVAQLGFIVKIGINDITVAPHNVKNGNDMGIPLKKIHHHIFVTPVLYENQRVQYVVF